jgi:hypothetical protein
MKMIALFRRKAGVTPEEFREHYETRHAPLAMRLFPYFKDYRRNYVRHDLAHTRAGGGDPLARLDFDAITEITFADKAGYDRMMRDMTDPAIKAEIDACEEQFMDRAATVVFLVDEETSPISG